MVVESPQNLQTLIRLKRTRLVADVRPWMARRGVFCVAYKMWCVFNIFGSRKSNSPIKPPRGPGDTVRPEDAQYLKQWAAHHAFVEGFVEPETLVNEMSVVLVAENGEFTRRRIGGPKGIDAVSKALGIPLYDVEETGYPDRMRKRMEQERILRKRAEQRERRARLERGEES